MAISGRHCRPVQAVEETYTPIASVAALSERHAGRQHAPHGFCGMRPPSLSLRGRSAPVAISGRHSQPVQAAVKMEKAEIWGVAALSERLVGNI